MKLGASLGWVWPAYEASVIISPDSARQVFDLAFSDSGSYFVTVGSRRVRFWYLDIAKDGRVSQAGYDIGSMSLLHRLITLL